MRAWWGGSDYQMILGGGGGGQWCSKVCWSSLGWYRMIWVALSRDWRWTDGSGRLTTRNCRFLRRYNPIPSSPPTTTPSFPLQELPLSPSTPTRPPPGERGGEGGEGGRGEGRGERREGGRSSCSKRHSASLRDLSFPLG